MPTAPRNTLETSPNPQPDRQYTIRMRIPEFTCLCPKTGQPDFATLLLEYVPDKSCVEPRRLLYVWSYRNEGAFHEAVTNRILDDLVAATAPRFMRLSAERMPGVTSNTSLPSIARTSGILRRQSNFLSSFFPRHLQLFRRYPPLRP